VQARVQYLHSPDFEPDEFAPADRRDATLFIQVLAGPGLAPGSAEPEGQESFDLRVITPSALQRRVRESGPRTGRHLVIVERWDYPTIAAYLLQLFESEQGADWDELGERLAHFGRWEFEDYDESHELGRMPPGVGAVVRSIRGIETAPSDLHDFRLPVQVTVGAVKGAGEGTFTVEVCTPAALERRVRSEGIILGEHLLIVDHWDAAAIRAALTRMFQSQDGATWPELADRLARYGAPAPR
jgi:hypothetical protein